MACQCFGISLLFIGYVPTWNCKQSSGVSLKYKCFFEHIFDGRRLLVSTQLNNVGSKRYTIVSSNAWNISLCSSSLLSGIQRKKMWLKGNIAWKYVQSILRNAFRTYHLELYLSGNCNQDLAKKENSVPLYLSRSGPEWFRLLCTQLLPVTKIIKHISRAQKHATFETCLWPTGSPQGMAWLD